MIPEFILARWEPKGFGIAVIAVLLIVAIPFACIRSCHKETPAQKLERTAERHRAQIAETLGGAHVERVSPPIGPWQLVKHGSFCYRSESAGKTIWAEAYISKWTIGIVLLGDDEPVYRYRYWGETKVLGKTFYPSIDR